MRVYLDQKLKFWMAMMGLITLIYVQFSVKTLNQKVQTGNDLSTLRDTEPQKRTGVVVLHRSGEYDSDSVLAVGNAARIAKQLNYNFVEVDNNWNNRLADLLTLYPDGVIVFDGTPRTDPAEVVKLEMETSDFTKVSQNTLLTKKFIGVVFTVYDIDLVKSYCENTPTPQSFVSSVVRTCAEKLKKDQILYVNKRRQPVLSERGER
jgi:hypothetical protein